ISSPRVEIWRRDVSGYVQQWRSAIPRFDDCTGGVACAGTRAGQCHTEFAGDTGVRICHVHGSAFMPRRHDTASAMPLESIVKRNVMDADDAENGVGTDPLQLLQKRISNCDLHSKIPSPSTHYRNTRSSPNFR